MHSVHDYDVVVDSVAAEIRELLKNRVIFIVPPGSLRGKIVEKLMDSGFEVLVYEDLYGRICRGSCKPDRVKPISGGLRVDGVDLIDYIRGGGKLSEALRRGGRAIVVKSTVEALLTVERIHGELVEELKSEGMEEKNAEKKAVKMIQEHVEVVFLPKLYAEALKDLDEDIRKIAEVDYSGVLDDHVEKPKGISPTLVEAAKSKGLSDVESGVRAIRSLSPEKTGLRDVVTSITGVFTRGLASALPLAPVLMIGGLASAAVTLSMLNLLSLEPLKSLRDTLNDWVQGFIMSSQRFAVFGEEFIVELAEKVFEAILRKRERSRALDSIPKLITAVIESKKYLEDEDFKDFEAVIDEVACRWGLSVEEFRNFVDNLFKLTTEKIVTEDEIDKLRQLKDEEFRGKLEEFINERWKKYREELEERLERLEKEIHRVREGLRIMSVSPGSTFFDADSWPYVEESDGIVKLKLSIIPKTENDHIHEAEYIHTPVEDELLSKLHEAVRKGKGLVLLRGEKGVGKSTATAVALWKMLKAYKSVVVELYINAGAGGGLLNKLGQFIQTAKKSGYRPILYVDPSKAGAYMQEIYDPERFAQSLRSTVEVLKVVSGDAVVLMVFSNDQYKYVEELLKNVELIKIDADKVLEENKVEFLNNIVEKYSGCSGEASSALAKLIAEEFQDNYVLVAVLAADELGRSGCKVEDVEKAVKEAEGRVHRFILDYIWRGLLGGDEDVARRHAPLIVATGLLGLHPRIWGEAVVRAFGHEPRGDIVEWLTQPPHGTVLEAIRKIAESAAKRAFNVPESEDMCEMDFRDSCRLVEICAKHLEDDPQAKRYDVIHEVADAYVERVTEALLQPRDIGGGKARAVDYVIREFMKRLGGEKVYGKWRLVHRVKMQSGEKLVERFYDELDALLIMYHVARYLGYTFTSMDSLALYLYDFIVSNKLEDLFSATPITALFEELKQDKSRIEREREQKLKELTRKAEHPEKAWWELIRSEMSYIMRSVIKGLQYKDKLEGFTHAPLRYIRKSVEKLLKSEEEKIARAKSILKDIEEKRYISGLDILRGMGLIHLIRLDLQQHRDQKADANMSIESISILSKLCSLLMSGFSHLPDETASDCSIIWGEVKRRNMDDETARSIIDYLAMAFHSPRNPRRSISGMLIALSHSDGTFEREHAISASNSKLLEDLIRRIRIQYFNTLYTTTSKTGKLALLDSLFYLDLKEALDYLGKQSSEELCDSIAQKVDDLLKEFDDGERNIAASLLYSGLTRCYAEMGEFRKAEKYTGESLEAVKNISVNGYEKLRPYLEVWFMRPDIAEELDLLRQVVYRRLSYAYLVMSRAEEAEKLAREACRIAKELGEIEDMLKSCMLAYGINTVRIGNWNTEEFKKLYSIALSEKQKLVNKYLEALTARECLVSLTCENLEHEISSSEVSQLMEKMRKASPLLPLINKHLFDVAEGDLYIWWNLYVEDAYQLRSPDSISDIFVLNTMIQKNPENLVEHLSTALRIGLYAAKDLEEVGRKTSLLKKVCPDANVNLIKSIIDLHSASMYGLIMFGLAYCRHQGSRWGCELAKVLAEIGSQKFKGIEAQLFSELAKAIEIEDWGKIIHGACRLHYLFSAYSV